MKKFIPLILLGLAVLCLGCVSEKQTTPTPTPTTTVAEEEIPINATINTTEIDELLNYLQEIESMEFSI